MTYADRKLRKYVGETTSGTRFARGLAAIARSNLQRGICDWRTVLIPKTEETMREVGRLSAFTHIGRTTRIHGAVTFYANHGFKYVAVVVGDPIMEAFG